MRKLTVLFLVVALLAGCTAAPVETQSTTQVTEKQEDGVMDILMIGNSYCYYFTEELYGIAKAAGIEMNICNVYSSGGTLEQHVTWHKTNEAKYRFGICNKDGYKLLEGWDLESCMAFGDWDIITFQHGNGPLRKGGLEGGRAATEPYLTQLLEIVQPRFPTAKYYWHQYWAPELGNDNATLPIDSIETQTAFYEVVRTISYEIRDKHDLPLIPTGDAWQAVRYDPMITEGGYTLCTRNHNGDPMYDDKSHDGDVGGGQYLNACVWFEVLTGKSCVGNTWRPNYSLTEEKIVLLQNAAHNAVVNMYGADFAK